MKKFFILIFIVLANFGSAEDEVQPNTAVTYQFSGGRFGDNLLSYIHAKYISHIYHIPLLYKPFQFSDQLVLDRMENKWDESLRGLFQKQVRFEANEDFVKFQERNALYIIPYFPEFDGEYGATYNGPWFDMDWNAPGFIKELRKLIKPLNIPKKFPRKKDAINVAIHMRTGSGPDSVGMTKMYFLKFPPQEYYDEQLIKIVKMFPNKRIFAYLFTDYPNPEELARRMAKKLSAFPISFGFRTDAQGEINCFESVVLEDFFGMMQYDCIIRPEANISYIAARLGTFQIEIYPVHGYWSGDKKVIDQVGIVDKRK